jgi:hypothetical protein
METAEPMSWRKSSYSSSNGGDCVEVVTISHVIAVRDSKNPAGTILAVTLDSWRAFTQGTKLTGHSNQKI